MPWEPWPLDGADLRLLPDFLSRPDADRLLARMLEEVAWRTERVTLFGRTHAVPRRVAWEGEPGARYRYSGVEHRAEGWSPAVAELRARVLEALPDHGFDGVLLNLYRDGEDAMGWHADDERDLGPDPVIASVSLGAERDFRMRRRRGDGWETSSRTLPHGSLLVMGGATQSGWQHCLPRRRRVAEPRVNASFRRVARRTD